MERWLGILLHFFLGLGLVKTWNTAYYHGIEIGNMTKHTLGS